MGRDAQHIVRMWLARAGEGPTGADLALRNGGHLVRFLVDNAREDARLAGRAFSVSRAASSPVWPGP